MLVCARRRARRAARRDPRSPRALPPSSDKSHLRRGGAPATTVSGRAAAGERDGGRTVGRCARTYSAAIPPVPPVCGWGPDSRVIISFTRTKK